MKKENFGQTAKGEQASLYTMENAAGMELKLTDYGASLVSLKVKDRTGEKRDVVLGYDDVEGYENGAIFLGATVGRNANRIRGAAFELGGKKYTLDANENGNNLHSGYDFYNKRLWEVKQSDTKSITFAVFSPDGDQGYPGDVRIEVSYTLTDENEVRISYRGIPSEDTILNLTNHSYFNLNGEGGDPVLNHQVCLHADAFTETDEMLIPTGRLIDVTGTPMDFRAPHTVGERIDDKFQQLIFGAGYDHCYVLNKMESGSLDLAATCKDPESGRIMEVYTTEVGVQLYTGNWLNGFEGAHGATFPARSAICFEAQCFPDTPNKPHFPSATLLPGDEYQQITVYKFAVEE